MLRLQHPINPTPNHRQPRPPLFPYTTLFRSLGAATLRAAAQSVMTGPRVQPPPAAAAPADAPRGGQAPSDQRSEEHTSELQSHSDLVCRLLLEKKSKPKLIWTAPASLSPMPQ